VGNKRFSMPGSTGRLQESLAVPRLRDYHCRVARKILEKILQEDPKLLMWYDQALTRTGG